MCSKLTWIVAVALSASGVALAIRHGNNMFMNSATKLQRPLMWSTSDGGNSSIHLSSLESEFTTIQHPAFPSHSVRIKKVDNEWCDSSVSAYSGYIDTTAARHLFFYFFESRNDPDTDDVIFWTTGGPGCSSSLGLFMELGPCRIVDDDGEAKVKYHPYSWNENANIFFIDQPISQSIFISYIRLSLIKSIQMSVLATRITENQSALPKKRPGISRPSWPSSLRPSRSSKAGNLTWLGNRTE
jgi:hypothetical protein